MADGRAARPAAGPARRLGMAAGAGDLEEAART